MMSRCFMVYWCSSQTLLNINSIKTSSTMELTKILRHDYSPGDTVNLDVFRMELDGTTNIINLTMKLGERP